MADRTPQAPFAFCIVSGCGPRVATGRRAWTLGCDAADPHRLAVFWTLALGHVPEPGYDEPDGAAIVDPGGVGPPIGFLRVPEGTVAKNRVHVDVRVGCEVGAGERERQVLAKVAALVAAGATQVRVQTYGPVLGHVVVLDPEANEFCVA